MRQILILGLLALAVGRAASFPDHHTEEKINSAPNTDKLLRQVTTTAAPDDTTTELTETTTESPTTENPVMTTTIPSPHHPNRPHRPPLSHRPPPPASHYPPPAPSYGNYPSYYPLPPYNSYYPSSYDNYYPPQPQLDYNPHAGFFSGIPDLSFVDFSLLSSPSYDLFIPPYSEWPNKGHKGHEYVEEEEEEEEDEDEEPGRFKPKQSGKGRKKPSNYGPRTKHSTLKTSSPHNLRRRTHQTTAYNDYYRTSF